MGLFLLYVLQFGCHSISTETKRPNFIFILADNLGYGDIACFGSKLHRTPNIDNLANEGIRLTSLYSSSGVCTPSRASLMTGCYAQRVDMHMDENESWVLYPVSAKRSKSFAGANPSTVKVTTVMFLSSPILDLN